MLLRGSKTLASKVSAVRTVLTRTTRGATAFVSLPLTGDLPLIAETWKHDWGKIAEKMQCTGRRNRPPDIGTGGHIERDLHFHSAPSLPVAAHQVCPSRRTRKPATRNARWFHNAVRVSPRSVSHYPELTTRQVCGASGVSWRSLGTLSLHDANGETRIVCSDGSHLRDPGICSSASESQ